MTRSAGLPLMAILLALTGCAGSLNGSAPPHPAGETISISRGPCFGFCPVYTLSVTPQGLATFDGTRHTAVLGVHSREDGAAAYTAVAKALAPFKPRLGTTAETRCGTQISDQPHIQVRWTASDGSATVLNHDKGCRSAENEALGSVLERVPSQLGVDIWSAQLTRPGVPRG